MPFGLFRKKSVTDLNNQEKKVSNTIARTGTNPSQEGGLGEQQPNNINDGVLLTARGTKGKVELLEQVIRIYESSKSGIDTVKEVPIKELRNVIFKKKGLSDGYIAFHFPESGFGGKIVYFKEDHQHEFELIEKEIEEMRKSASELKNRALTHWKKGEYDAAVLDFDRVIRINPKDTIARDFKGLAAELKGNCEDALVCYDESIEINPQNVAPWYYKARTLAKQGKYDEALQASNRAIEIDPNSIEAQVIKQQIQKKDLGNFDNETLAKEILNKKPNAVSKNIAKILQRRGLSPNEVLIATEGANGQICLTEKGVIIGREGGIGNKLVVGFTKGEKFLPYRNITGVQFKEPGMTVGYIQFTVPGGIESRGGAFDAVSDENTVTFIKNELEIFRKIRDIVEERQGLGSAPNPAVPTPQVLPQSSIADELTKLAALKRDGAITEEEFMQLKKDLLSSKN